MNSLALAPLALLLVPADGPRYAPTSGTSLTKTFTETTEVSLDAAIMTMNGEDREREMELQILSTRTVEVTDTYHRAADGKVSKLTRTYQDIAGTISFEVDQRGDVDTGEFEGTSGLAGNDVTFEIDQDGDLTKAYAEGSKGEPAWLDDLALDMDLAAWMPTEDVEAGESWTIPAEALSGLLAPGNVPRCDMENVGGDDDSEAILFGTFFCLREVCANADGDFEATWTGSEETDGQKLATIALEFDVTFERDVLDTMSELGQAIGEDEVDAMTDANVAGAFEGKGVLVWNLTTGLPQSLELEGEVAIELGMDIEQGGRDMHMQLEMSGSSVLTLETETP